MKQPKGSKQCIILVEPVSHQNNIPYRCIVSEGLQNPLCKNVHFYSLTWSSVITLWYCCPIIYLNWTDHPEKRGNLTSLIVYLSFILALEKTRPECRKGSTGGCWITYFSFRGSWESSSSRVAWTNTCQGWGEWWFLYCILW